ncbi:hypothetical protein PUN28_004030 [Cardiocondyla obscurior]|uniref:Uncharacterized protein n=1 Tax=Cardiocondyla obscurior TaxID=286306 RepID=A0AAW2GP14_9HYME
MRLSPSTIDVNGNRDTPDDFRLPSLKKQEAENQADDVPSSFFTAVVAVAVVAVDVAVVVVVAVVAPAVIVVVDATAVVADVVVAVGGGGGGGCCLSLVTDSTDIAPLIASVFVVRR